MFGKKKEVVDTPVKKASDRIVFAEMEDDDELARDLVLKLKDNQPLIINFSNINELSTNKFIAFFSGATIALDGKIVFLKTNVYLFIKREDLIDGSVKELISSLNLK